MTNLDASEMDPRTDTAAAAVNSLAHNQVSFAQMGVLDAWQAYAKELTWGKGQCLAILDDGCDLDQPAWQAKLPWGPKVIATWNSIEGNENCMHVPPGYHGTTVGIPSSVYLDDVRGVAYHNHIAQVRCVSVVHLRKDESGTMADGLKWVAEHHQKYNITAVNLSPLDDQQHQTPMPTVIDEQLAHLQELGIWVSAPAGNHHYTEGISWPACQPGCFAIGATIPGQLKVHLDRYSNIDLLAPATATSSSNAYTAGCAQILREAIDKTHYPWQSIAQTLPQAMCKLFQETGLPIHDELTGLSFKQIDIKAALDKVFGVSGQA